MTEIHRLREAYRAAAEGPHPPEATWEAFAMGELSEEEERELLRHTLSCPDCAAVHRALLQVRREAAAFDPGAPRLSSRMRRPFRGMPTLLAAAAVLLAASVVVLLRPAHGPGPTPTPRGAGGETLRLIRPVGEVTTPLPPFTWTEVPGARGYVVELLDSGGNTIWRSPEVRGTSVSAPEGVLPREGVSHWRVEVHPGPTGRPWFSETATFTVRR